MNNVTVARLYMLFALALLIIGWKISASSAELVKEAQLKQSSEIERVLSSLE